MRNTPLSYVLRLTSARAALALAAAQFLLFAPSSLRAEEWGFAFSGQLQEIKNDAKGIARLDGKTNYEASVFIRLYDDSDEAATAKSQALWGRKIGVRVKNGMFSCELKDSAGDGMSLAGAKYAKLQDAFAHLGGSEVTVGVTPFSDDNAEIAPRQVLSSVPYAVNAGDALGTVGDATVAGTLSTGALTAQNVTYRGSVTHAGEVLFDSDPKFPNLALGADEPLTADRLAAAKDIAVRSIEADRVRVTEATAQLQTLASGSVSNLSVTGAVTAKNLRPLDKALTVEGAVGTTTLKVRDLVIGGGLGIFNWSGDPLKLDGASESSSTHYTGDASSGTWTATCNCLMSLSFQSAGTVTVSLTLSDGSSATVATIKTGGMKEAWFPVPVFVRKGQTISWTGGSDVLVTYRAFTY